MSTFTDANFTYSVVSVPNKTLAIIGINPSNGTYSASNASWGALPAIPAVYAGSNVTYNGAGVPANAFKVVEIGANAFDSLTSFSATTLTPAFLPANLRRIGERAFAGVKLQGSLTIPETLDSVGFQAFHSTLITDIVIGSATNADIVTHLANLTSVIQQEINDRAAADASLNALKAPIDAATFTGSATIPNAVIGLATVSSASIAAANVGVASIANAQLSVLTVVGNAAFTGSVLATGEWNFTVKPKINDAVVATETYVNDRFASVAGPSLVTALDTLDELASAIGGDTSFATNIIQSHTSISAMLSTEMSARSNAVLALSSALSTSASSLTVVDSALSTALSGEVSARTASISAMSTTLSTNASTLQANNVAFSTALATEVSARSSALSVATSTHGAAASSLAVVDSVLSSALSTEVSARSSAVASFAPVITDSAASLTTVDETTVAALSTETSTRGSEVASLSQMQSSAFSSLSVTTSSLSVALSTEVGARSDAISSLSTSASTAAVSLQQPNTQFSIALAAEVVARVSAVASLSTSISGSLSSLVSEHSSAVSVLSTETSARTVAVSSASVSVTNAVASNSASIVVHDSAISAETSLRTSQLQSVSTVASTAVSSLSQSISGISSALSAEISTRTVAVSSAIATILSGAPSRFNTLGKIVSELSTNQSLTITADTLSRVSALKTAVSNETSARISAVASLSNTAIASLLAVDTGLISPLSAETSGRGVAVTSLSSELSAARVSLAAVNDALSTALSSETATRVSAVASVSEAVVLVVSSLSAADTSLSTALSTETSTRVIAAASLVDAGSLSFASLNVVKTATSGNIATETSARIASIASVSGAISASFASLQTSNDAVRSKVSTLSAALAPKATTSYLDGKIATLLSGAPAQLNTLAEMAAALNNDANFASSIATALAGKATAADASTVAVAIATKGTQSQLTSLETVVSSKAPLTLLTSTTSGIVSLTNVVNALATAISTLQANGGSVNGATISVDGVGIETMATRIQELYYKLGTDNPSLGLVNADGTVNYKVNPLANPTLVSSDLAFEYDANGVVTKVTHMITVQFDSDQTSATVTGGVGNPVPTITVNNIKQIMTANNSTNYTFTVEYAGNLSFYEANKTEVSIVALESAYKSAPLSPTVVASAPLLPFLELGTNNETLTYTGTAANVGSTEPLFFQANPGGTRSIGTRSIGGGAQWFAVVNQGMKNAISGYADGTSTPFKPPGQTEPVPWTNIITTLMTDMSNLFMNKTTFNEPINTWDTVAVTNMAAMFSGATAFNRPIGPWNTLAVTNMASMFSGASAFNQPIDEWKTDAVTTMASVFSGASAFNQPLPWNTAAVTTMDSVFSGATAFNQPIPWNTTAVVNMASMFSGASLFNQPIDTWNTGAVTAMTAMFSGASAFNKPVSTWNMTAVTNIDSMFSNASSFNQSISTWNLENVTTPPTNFNTGSALTAADPTLVSSVLGFEYGANDVVTKVNHMITVQFDRDQTSATVTGGVGNPTITVTNINQNLNASNHYTFTIVYDGDITFYDANKTNVSIVALASPPYKSAPSSPTVLAPALDATNLVHDPPTMVANSMTVTVSGSTYTYTATFTNAGNAVMEVLNPDNTVAASQPTVNLPYVYTYDSSKIGSPIFKIRTKRTVSKRPSAFLTINGIDVPPVLSNFTLGTRAIDTNAMVLPTPTSTATVTYTANTYNQVGERFLFTSPTNPTNIIAPVRISPDGTKVAIGGISGDTRGIVRVYSLNSSTNTWTQMGGDILGTAANQSAGAVNNMFYDFSVLSMSADGKLVAIIENALGSSGRLNIFKYDPLKTAAQTNSGLANFGPVNWSRVSNIPTISWNPRVALSADGKTLAVLDTNDGNGRPRKLTMYHSTDGGLTWPQRGLSLFDYGTTTEINVGHSYQRFVSISANGLQVVVASSRRDSNDGDTVTHIIMYEWNGNAWIYTALRTLRAAEWNVAALSYDGKVVVSASGGNSSIVRSHKNESGTWINTSVTTQLNYIHGASLSADGSILLLRGDRTVSNPTNTWGDVEIHRWNGTAYVAVINNRSITNRGSSLNYNTQFFDAMLSADGTRLIVGNNVSNADVYDLVATNKFSYETSNSAVAELHGNIALFKSAGSSTITATQTTPAGNASIASELTVTEIIRAANGVTIQYVGVVIPTLEPRFIQANPRGTGLEWFAVVPQSMATAIANYASGTSGPFIPSGQSEPVPWNNIVTTLMTDMGLLFYGKSNFNGQIGPWDTSNVTTMHWMFRNAPQFNQNIGSWNTSKVKDMSYMFQNSTTFNQNINSWNTSSVTDMNNMFHEAYAFNQNISSWNTSSVTNMQEMFLNASPFNQPISGWVVSQVTNYSSFSDNSALTAANTPPFGRSEPFLVLNATNGVTIRYTGLAADVSPTRFILSNPRGTGIEWFVVVNQSMKNAIQSYASGTTAQFIPPGQSVPVIWNNIVTSLMTDMKWFFLNQATFNQPIGAWDTSNVTTTHGTFQGCSIFNQPIGEWDTSNVTTMDGMFQSSSIFNQPISAWNTSKVLNMHAMFWSAGQFNQDLSGWDVDQVTNSSSFSDNSALTAANTPPFGGEPLLVLNATNGVTIRYTGTVPTSIPRFIISNPRGTGMEWFAVVTDSSKSQITSYADNLTSVRTYFTPSGRSIPVTFNNIVTTLMTNMASMFHSVTTFNQPIDSWHTSNVTSMAIMFRNAQMFNQPIGSWNTSSVTDMNNMFHEAYAFNQNIGNWNVSNVTNMNLMFRVAFVFNNGGSPSIGTWNTAKVKNMGYMFTEAHVFNQDISSWNTAIVNIMSSMFQNALVFNQNLSGWNVGQVTHRASFQIGSPLELPENSGKIPPFTPTSNV
jgi:surface protein